MPRIAALQNPFPKFFPPFLLMILLDRCSKSSLKLNLPIGDGICQGEKGFCYVVSKLGDTFFLDIHTVYRNHGYTLKEIADYPGIHYTGVSKEMAKIAGSKKLKFQGLTFGPLYGNSSKEAL